MSREIIDRPPISADRRVAYGPDPSQFYDLFLPSQPDRRAAVVIHGGYWRSVRTVAITSHLCATLAAHGVTAANLEYRRTGVTGGGWPRTFDDILAGFTAIRKEVDSAPPVVIGHSAGGHLALLLATRTSDLAGIVALGAVADLEFGARANLGDGAVAEFLGGSPDEIPDVYEDACPSRHQCAVPRTLIQGTADDIVPLGMGAAYAEMRRGDARVKLVDIPRADHFDLIDPQSPAFPLVLAAVFEIFETRGL